jgi:hypothetical protein
MDALQQWSPHYIVFDSAKYDANSTIAKLQNIDHRSDVYNSKIFSILSQTNRRGVLKMVGKPLSTTLQLTGDAYRNFVESLASEATKMYYVSWLRQFMVYCKFDRAEQLLEEDAKVIQPRIIDYLIHTRSTKKISPKTLRGYVATLHHFYEMNDMTTLNWKKIIADAGLKEKM